MMTPVNSCAKNALQDENVPGDSCLRFRVLPCSYLLLPKRQRFTAASTAVRSGSALIATFERNRVRREAAYLGLFETGHERRENRSESLVKKHSELIALNRVFPAEIVSFASSTRGGWGPCNSLGSPHPLVRNVQPSDPFCVRSRLLALSALLCRG